MLPRQREGAAVWARAVGAHPERLGHLRTLRCCVPSMSALAVVPLPPAHCWQLQTRRRPRPPRVRIRPRHRREAPVMEARPCPRDAEALLWYWTRRPRCTGAVPAAWPTQRCGSLAAPRTAHHPASGATGAWQPLPVAKCSQCSGPAIPARRGVRHCRSAARAPEGSAAARTVGIRASLPRHPLHARRRRVPTPPSSDLAPGPPRLATSVPKHCALDPTPQHRSEHHRRSVAPWRQRYPRGSRCSSMPRRSGPPLPPEGWRAAHVQGPASDVGRRQQRHRWDQAPGTTEAHAVRDPRAPSKRTADTRDMLSYRVILGRES